MKNISLMSSAKLLAMLLLALLCLGALPGSGSITPALAALPGTGAPSVERDKRVLALQVYFRTEAERHSLALEFGAEKVLTADTFLTVWGDEVSYRTLLARGLRVGIDAELTEKANKVVLGPSVPGTFFGGYHTVEEVEAFLTLVAQENPGLAEKVDVGDSWCKSHLGACTLPEPYGGYDLWALHITNQAIPGPKPVFWFDAGIHSREIATPELAMRYISLLLDGYETNADARWLVDYHDIWVIPILNPDGHHIVEAGGGGEAPYLHRKNADNNDNCTDWPPSNGSQFGVDLNRNFIARWACCGASSPDPCSLVYHGTKPGSEDETQWVMSKVRSLIPDQRGPLESDAAPITTTGILQSIHSFGAVHIYPSSFRPNPVLNAGDMQNMAHHMGAIDAGGSGYDSCDAPDCYAIIDGAAIMWAYSELGVPAFTTEISGGFFFPAYSDVDFIWEENRGSLIYMAKIARTPYLTTRGPDANAVTVEPGVVVVGATAHLSATINSAWQGNLYTENVFAAEYYIDTPPWAGGTPISLQPSDGAYDELTENVEAEISTIGLAPGKHIIFVRGRGVSTHEGYASWGPISAAFLEVVTTLPTVTATATENPAQTPTTAPTFTSTGTSTSTPVATGTPTTTSTTTVVASGTSTSTAVVATPSSTAVASGTPTACTISFSDVPSGHTFYANVRCLACRGVLGGYADGTFRPGNNITRGQIAKVVSNAAGFSETVSGQTFTDVPGGHTFYEWIERLTGRAVMSGYDCGRPSEPCDGENRPYFRPGADATRGQLSKIVSNAASFNDTATGQFYADVATDNPFYQEIMRLTNRNVMSGYACGGSGEPCDSENRPYFRWGSPVTRGQASKIVANTFFPGCATP
jgi:carboxypeptidase T